MTRSKSGPPHEAPLTGRYLEDRRDRLGHRPNAGYQLTIPLSAAALIRIFLMACLEFTGGSGLAGSPHRAVSSHAINLEASP
jgi:hypothetical protein